MAISCEVDPYQIHDNITNHEYRFFALMSEMRKPQDAYVSPTILSH